jgi:hypothetical protein
MHVEVDHRDTTNGLLRAQQADGDRDVVEDAESLAVIGKRVVRAAGEVHRHAVHERVPRRRDRAAHGATRPLHERGRPGEAEPPQLRFRHVAIGESLDVVRRVHEPEHLVGRGVGIHHPLGRDDAFGHHALAQHGVLLDGESMPRRQREGVSRRRPHGERHQRGVAARVTGRAGPASP